jgi:hypothetical protein
MQQKEINKTGYDRLLETINSIKKEADKNPEKKCEGYLLQAGKQQAYSHIWFEMQPIIEQMNKFDAGYINWKVFNLLIGFAAGGICALLLNGCI